MQIEEKKRQEEEERRQEESNLLSQQMESALALLQPQVDKAVSSNALQGHKEKQWIACDQCDQWYHVKCVGLTAKKAESLPNWNCGLC